MVTVPSPEGVQDYALTPEMSAGQTTEEILNSLQNPAYQVVIANLANVDVVGHSASKPSVLRAVEAVDTALGRIVRECLLRNVACVITSDHGTVEEWLYPDGKINTGHTKNKVPFSMITEGGNNQTIITNCFAQRTSCLAFG